MITFTPHERASLYAKHAPHVYRVQTFFMVQGAAWFGNLVSTEYFVDEQRAQAAFLEGGMWEKEDDWTPPNAYYGDRAVKRHDVMRIFTDFSPATHPKPDPEAPSLPGEEIALAWLEQDYLDTYGPRNLWTDPVRESFEDRLAVLRDFVHACWPTP